MSYYVPQPPPEIFSSTKPVTTQKPKIIERIEYPETGGILVYYKDHPKPKWGFPFPRAVITVQHIKRTAMSLVRIALKQKISLGLAFIHPKPTLKHLADEFVLKYACAMLGSVILKPERMCPSTRELNRTLYAVADGNKRLEGLARLISHIFEYDNAWRYRLQDILGELSKSNYFTNRSKEITRLAELYAEREVSIAQTEKIKHISKLTKLLLLRPLFRKYLDNIVVQLDLETIRPDANDLYWMSLRPDYNANTQSTKPTSKNSGK